MTTTPPHEEFVDATVSPAPTAQTYEADHPQIMLSVVGLTQPSDIQGKIAEAEAVLAGTTSSGVNFVTRYGSDQTKWPLLASWTKGFDLLDQASALTGGLIASGSATPEDVVAKITQAKNDLMKTTLSGRQMAKKYKTSDMTRWGPGAWHNAVGLLQTASLEAGNLAQPPPPPAFRTNVTDGTTVKAPFDWKFDPGVDTDAGYFWADGVLLKKIVGSRPYEHTLAVGELTTGTHLLGHAWDLTDGSHHAPPSGYSVVIDNGTPTPPIPPQPSNGSLVFDGRAATFLSKYPKGLPYMAGTGSATRSQVSDTDTTYYSPFANSLATQGPFDYAGALYMGYDIKIVDRQGYPGGKAFHINPKPGDHNPYNTAAPAGDTSALMSRRDTTKPGKWQWWSCIMEMISFDAFDWASFLNFNYETLQWDQLAWMGHYGNWSAYQHAGEIGPNGEQLSGKTVTYYQDIKPIKTGVVEKFAIGALQAADYNGEVQFWHCPGGVWTLAFRKTGVPTYLWGGNPPYSPITQAQLQAGSGVLQKGNEVYCGKWNEQPPAPTCEMYSSGWVEATTIEAAQAALS